MLQYTNITCDPPLGQATIVPFGQNSVRFTVVIESTGTSAAQPWEVLVWHDGHDDHQWRELPMHEDSQAVPLLEINAEDRKGLRRLFQIDLPRPTQSDRPVHFTLKYRLLTSENWRWAKETQSLEDGELCFQPGKVDREYKHYFKNYSSDLDIRPEQSQSPGATLWKLTAPLNPAKGDQSGWTETNLGLPRSYTRWFCLVRPWTPWIAPRHGKAPFDCGNGSVLSAFLRWDGLSLVVLAVSGVADVLIELKPDDQGNVIAVSRNEREEVGQANILVAVAPDFETASAACIYQARTIVQGYVSPNRELQALHDKIQRSNGEVGTQSLVDWHDGLTYCTWNSLGQGLNEDKIFNALNDLKKHNIHITNLIIDDNWQSLNDVDGPSQWDLSWSEFEANKKNFPHGLKYLATKIREDHPNIQHIAVWHALLGYWNGIDPNGKIASEYKTKTISKDGGGEMTIVDTDDIDRMYNDFYDFLISCTVDAVKTDAQYGLDLLGTAPDRRQFINKVQDTWNLAALRHFGIKAISCMSQFPQNIFHSQLLPNKPQFMVRNSDDYFPDILPGHAPHVFINAHNALFNFHLNILPDWDMFQTKNNFSGFHAAARCVSGGPVYITDYPGQHDMELIAQITAVTTRGQTIVLRPSIQGKTVEMYTSLDESRFLKVGSFHGSKGGTSILSLFNMTEHSQAQLVNFSSFPGTEKDQDYIVRAHTTGDVSKPLSTSSKAPVLSIKLPYQGYEVLSAFPLYAFTLGNSTGLKSSATAVAILGLLRQITGAAAVTGSDLRMQGGRLRVQVTLKALGVFGLYLSTAHSVDPKEDLIVTIQSKVIPFHTVHVDRKQSVLEVDVEQAWKEMALTPGYSEGVTLEIWIR